MRRMWIAAMLLASATAVPAFAQDQDHNGHDGGGNHQDGGQNGGGQNGGGQRGGGEHGGGQGGQHQGGGGGHQGGNPGGGAPGGGNPGAQPQHFQPQPQHFQPQVQQGQPGGGFAPHDRGPGGTPGVRPPQGFTGGERGNPGNPRQFNSRADNGVQVWQGQPGGRDDHGRPVTNGQATRDWNGQWNGGRNGNGQRGDHGQGWNEGRPNGGRGWNGDHANNGQGRNGDHGNDGHGWNGDRHAGGGDWNRGWRQDQRYNWQGWRSQHREIYRAGRYRAPYGAGYGYRRFGIGYRIDPIFFAEDYWIDNPDYYRLPPAYGEYRWVRYYNDALLIDIEDGEVVDAIPNFFY